ncbi:hypothetical protein Vadar_013450 [Vaccinium darrowii]|uniref:Uncharacterized protein n=1 Tax=Vaccinium darrowii TaxID=229202 RepID=A0ACB7YL91_9ERIC|nr:hypothetical protein Vadar_013450 [Vaccinium darrowii]
METWFIIIVSLCIAALIKPIFDLTFSLFSTSHHQKKKLPPGPTNIPVIGTFLWLFKSFTVSESALRSLRAKYGPIITLPVGSRPAIFIGSHSVAHKALVQKGAVFSGRPKSFAASEIDANNQQKISTATYGPRWRLLRRNITSEVLHPSRLKFYAAARQRVLGVLIDRLVRESQSEAIRVADHFRFAMSSVLVLMCFGDRLNEKQIKEVERVQRQLLVAKTRFLFLNFWPMLSKIVFRNRYRKLIQLRQSQEEVLIPLIRSRVEIVERRRLDKKEEEKEDSVVSYVDTLLKLELPDEKRKLNEKEIVSLCGEFLNAGIDSTSSALEWIMANLVKYPHVQTKLYEDINGVVGPPPKLIEKNDKTDLVVIKDKDLQRMLYLKYVVLEGLRRHPPTHISIPHSVTEDVELEGYLVPKDTTVNFMVADLGWDPKVWDEPMEFKPERFLTNSIGGSSGGGEVATFFDLTGSREIKMMPFGAGRRICPALGLALLHLEIFVANLIWYFEWRAVEGDPVDLSEKQGLNTPMKYPLRAQITLRGPPQN